MRSGMMRCSQPSELVHAFDADLRRAMARDFAAHLDEHSAQSETSGSQRGADGTVSPSASAAAHMTLMRPRTVGPWPRRGTSGTLRAGRGPRRRYCRFRCGTRAELLQARGREVDRPIANRASAGDRDDRLAALGQQRPEHADAGPHRLRRCRNGLRTAFIAITSISSGPIQPAAGRPPRPRFGLMAINMTPQLADELVSSNRCRSAGERRSAWFSLRPAGRPP